MREQEDSSEEFISHTIKLIDNVLEGERQADTQELLQQWPTNEDDDPLCWRCQEPESEHYGQQGYCNEQYEQGQTFQRHPPEGEGWDAEARTMEELMADELTEFNEMLDQDWLDYWSRHCVKHGEELHGGKCAICQQEEADERINDR